MSFVRVRSARPGAALHEFDIPLVTYEHHPDRYKVISKEPVAKQRPASHISGVVAAPAPARKPRVKPRKAAPKSGEDKPETSEANVNVEEEK